MPLFNINLENQFCMESAIISFREFFWEIRMQRWSKAHFKLMEYQLSVPAEAILSRHFRISISTKNTTLPISKSRKLLIYSTKIMRG